MIELPAEPKRILIVKPSALGDIVHALPFLSLLRKRFKTAEITWLVTPAFASLLQGHPLLDQVMLFDRKRFPKLWKEPSAAKALVGFAADLRSRQFDLAIDLQGLLRSGWITWQSRAATRVGFSYARELSPLFYTHRVSTPSPERHAIERYLDVAVTLGCDREPVVFDFAIDDAVRASTQALLGDIGRYCVLLPGTNWPTKRWPAERFAALVEPIERRFGLRCVLAGGADAAEMAEKFPTAVNLSGKTSIRQLVALLERASLVIANDSGPMHIASALNRPLVTVFGPTNPIRTGPYGRLNTVVQLDLLCHPCYQRTCSHHSCMQWLTPDHVLAAAERQLESPAPA